MTESQNPRTAEPSIDYKIRRHVHDALRTALTDTRVVVLLGARQTGKSTLARTLAAEIDGMEVASLDNRTLREAANADPKGFLTARRRPILIDEIQRAPDLLLEIKDIVDDDQTPGQFLVTGSANILTAPKIKDALTGRAEYITLWPLSQAEIAGSTTNFVDALFAGEPPRVADAPVGRDAFAEIVAAGGYPEARLRVPARRRVWFRNYVRSLVERDLRDISDAERLSEVPRLLRLIASQAANLFVASTIGNKMKLDNKTVAAYTGLLETIYIVRRVQAWTPGIGSREIQHEKIYIVDSGLMANLLGANAQRIRDNDQITGRILENFVAMEIARLAEVSETLPRQYHYRQQSGRDEIDVVLEDDYGQITAAEVKAAATVDSDDYRALVKLRDARGDRFLCGVVFYTGPDTVPLTDRILAAPISALWA
jgi:predicted AAA+ superfamily ATPase